MNELTHLGKQSPILNDPSLVILDAVPNPDVENLYSCRFTVPEFTSLCPHTGQPDFALILIDYVPNKHLLESKSLKLLTFAYRNRGSFHEKCTMEVGKKIYDTIAPYWLRIAGFWNGRGGISIEVVGEFGKLPDGVRPLSIDNVKLYNNGHY